MLFAGQKLRIDLFSPRGTGKIDLCELGHCFQDFLLVCCREDTGSFIEELQGPDDVSSPIEDGRTQNAFGAVTGQQIDLGVEIGSS